MLHHAHTPHPRLLQLRLQHPRRREAARRRLHRPRPHRCRSIDPRRLDRLLGVLARPLPPQVPQAEYSYFISGHGSFTPEGGDRIAFRAGDAICFTARIAGRKGHRRDGAQGACDLRVRRSAARYLPPRGGESDFLHLARRREAP